jgi:uncharacterized protein involved in exopolysaccharide biosynthesis
MSEDEKKSSPHDVLRLIFRRRYLFLVGGSVATIAIMLGSHYVPLKYTGKAIFEVGVESTAQQVAQSSNDLATMQERLQHDVVGLGAMEEAADELGITRRLPRDAQGRLTDDGRARQQRMLEGMAKGVEITIEARSNQEDLVSVKFTSDDKKLAQQLPNALVADYINRTFERIRGDLKDQCEFLRTKVAGYDQVAQEAQAKQTEFEMRNSGFLPESPGMLQEKILRTRSDVDALRQRQAATGATIAKFRAMGQGGPTTNPSSPQQTVMQPNPELASLKIELQKLKDQRADCISVKDMTPSHPQVVALDERIAQLQKQIAETPAESVKETVYGAAGPVDVTGALAMLLEESKRDAELLAHNESDLARLEGLWAKFGPVRQEWLALAKERDDRAAEAKHWRERLENAQALMVASVNNRLTHLKAIQPAREQTFPSFPTSQAVLGLAIAAGVAIGVLLVFLSKVLNRTISTSEEITSYFHLPVCGVICEITTSRQRLMRKLRRYTLGPIVAIMLASMLFLSGMSVTLRIQDPTRYWQLRTAPLAFLEQEYIKPAHDLLKKNM